MLALWAVDIIFLVSYCATITLFNDLTQTMTGGGLVLTFITGPVVSKNWPFRTQVNKEKDVVIKLLVGQSAEHYYSAPFTTGPKFQLPPSRRTFLRGRCCLTGGVFSSPLPERDEAAPAEDR